MVDANLDRRQKMVDGQIRARGVRDPRVLLAMARVPREAFVPAADQARAFDDHPLPIAGGQTISQPYIVAYMTELLELEPGHRVLEIGTGSAYQTAVLAELAAEVWSIEVVPALAASAAAMIARLGYASVRLRHGSGWEGWPDAAPFDRIIVTAAPPGVPEALKDQLATGGVLVVPVGSRDQRMVKIRRTGGGFTEEALIPVRFVPMVR
ncbi:MAG: protein-L-isoaspartate(D-aspartate) O-methyltransferase [Acidobacteriota bacterium]|nr:protein-L-isoaspartate(D-aspartate) O-methyltransferase [Acidobacteriota bacterium]